MPSPRSSSSYSSSSSRSSSSSSRSSSSSGPSSRSSSSYSSSSRSSSSYSSSRSHASSPSSRSRTSYSSPSRYVAGGSMKGRTISRSRRNQPRGYVVKEHSYRSPTNHMCVNHNYVYYPDDWTDSSGTSYRKGYYDENGTYYENVIFKQNGRYNKVPCRCQYCGVTTNINLTSEQTLLCSRCGAPLEIQAALDEYTQDPLYTRENPPLTAGQKIRRVLLKPWVIILLALLGLGIFAAKKDSTEVAYPMAEEIRAPYEYASLSNLELFGEQIRLNRTEDGSYVFAPASADSWDKELNWNDDEGFFYDADSDCWLDYNTDIDPAVWQYWYEGISSDFGDCGWMEYADGAWRVEASPGNWTPLPDKYDSSGLWHLEPGPAEHS